MLNIINALLSIIPAIGKILGIVERYFPPKSPAQRAVEKQMKAIDERKTQNKKIAAVVKAAKKGKTDALERILNK